MASKRRGGFRPPELRGTLGTLLRTTTDVVRGALERGAREGRARFDDLRTSRRRHDALAELGDIVLDLVRRGEIDLAELPEARDLIRELDDLDSRDDSDAEPTTAHASTRRRFDDRGRSAADPDPDPDRAPAPDDDGTVSSGAAARSTRPTIPDLPRPETPSTRAQTKPMKGVWRPVIDQASAMPERSDHASRSERPTVPDRRPPSEAALRAAARTSAAAERPPRRADTVGPATDHNGADRASPDRASPDRASPGDRSGEPAGGDDRDDEPGGHRTGEPRGWLPPRDPDRKGGIRFDEDDLADYMHPDDVPPRSPRREPGDGDP